MKKRFKTTSGSLISELRKQIPHKLPILIIRVGLQRCWTFLINIFKKGHRAKIGVTLLFLLIAAPALADRIQGNGADNISTRDEFAVSSNTNLDLHLPFPIGLLWIKETDTTGGAATVQAISASGDISPSTDVADDQLVYSAGNAPAIADYGVGVTVKTADTGATNVFCVGARNVSGSSDGYWYCSGGSGDALLGKIVSGTWTTLGTDTGGFFTDGDELEIRTDKTIISSYKNGIQVGQVFDSDITDPGKPALGFGDLKTTTDDIGADWVLDDFQAHLVGNETITLLADLVNEDFASTPTSGGGLTWNAVGSATVSGGEGVVTTTAGSEEYWEVNFTSNTEVWASMNITIDPAYVISTVNHDVNVMTLLNGGSRHTFLAITNDGGTLKFLSMFRPDTGGTQQFLASTPLVLGQTYSVTMHFKKNSGVDVTDGIHEIWIDGVQELDINDADNDTRAATSQIRMGGYLSGTSATGEQKIDNLLVGTSGVDP